MYYLVLTVGAGLPALILLKIFLKRDSQKPEPAGLIIGTFFLGILSIIPAAIMEGILSLFGYVLPSMLMNFFRAFLVAGLCEEAVKMGVVRGFTARRKAFDEITDGIVYSITAGLGFAFYENIMYAMNSPNFIRLLLLRSLTSVPLHALSSGIMGYFIGKSYFTDGEFFGRGLFFAVLIHGLYNFILFSPVLNNWLIFPLLAGVYPVLFKLIALANYQDKKLGLS